MVIDVHGHVSAPVELYAYQAQLIASRGFHGKHGPGVDEAKIVSAVAPHLALLRDARIDQQLISPRPFAMMHSQKPGRIVHWFMEAANDIIAEQVRLYPDVFHGVCGLPQVAGESPAGVLDELERCVTELGFVGCVLNPDPGEGDGAAPGLGDEHWYPLYEKLVELDVPALVHSAACCNLRESYSGHFITEESIAILSLMESRVFEDFPSLKLVISHGGGSVPYQIGRWRARWVSKGKDESFDESLRRLWFDTVLYNRESLELLFRLVGHDRCLFGTEKPGVGSAVDPRTGRAFDDLRPVIEQLELLDDAQRRDVFELNVRGLYNRLPKPASVI